MQGSKTRFRPCNYLKNTVWGPVLHFRRKIVFLTSEEPWELEISPRASFNMKLFGEKLSASQHLICPNNNKNKTSVCGPSSQPPGPSSRPLKECKQFSV